MAETGTGGVKLLLLAFMDQEYARPGVDLGYEHCLACESRKQGLSSRKLEFNQGTCDWSERAVLILGNAPGAESMMDAEGEFVQLVISQKSLSRDHRFQHTSQAARNSWGSHSLGGSYRVSVKPPDTDFATAIAAAQNTQHQLCTQRFSEALHEGDPQIGRHAARAAAQRRQCCKDPRGPARGHAARGGGGGGCACRQGAPVQAGVAHRYAGCSAAKHFWLLLASAAKHSGDGRAALSGRALFLETLSVRSLGSGCLGSCLLLLRSKWGKTEWRCRTDTVVIGRVLGCASSPVLQRIKWLGAQFLLGELGSFTLQAWSHCLHQDKACTPPNTAARLPGDGPRPEHPQGRHVGRPGAGVALHHAHQPEAAQVGGRVRNVCVRMHACTHMHAHDWQHSPACMATLHHRSAAMMKAGDQVCAPPVLGNGHGGCQSAPDCQKNAGSMGSGAPHGRGQSGSP
eukprot:1144270-Pelagomonas_calceolata.AAC.14